LTPFDENIALSGNSDISWYLEASAVPRIIGGWTIDFEPLLADLQSAFRADAGELDGTVLFFTRLDRLTDESETVIESLATQLQLLSESAGPLGIDMTITLVGEADGIGNLEQNTRVSRNRVRVVQDLFTGAGIDPKYINDQYPLWNPGNRNLEKRRVTVRVTGSDSK
jgi:outer membrane protein OmpA-like peptidoglycan-associated protein